MISFIWRLVYYIELQSKLILNELISRCKNCSSCCRMSAQFKSLCHHSTFYATWPLIEQSKWTKIKSLFPFHLKQIDYLSGHTNACIGINVALGWEFMALKTEHKVNTFQSVLHQQHMWPFQWSALFIFLCLFFLFFCSANFKHTNKTVHQTVIQMLWH